MKSVSDKIYDFGDVLEQSYRTAEPQNPRDPELQRTEDGGRKPERQGLENGRQHARITFAVCCHLKQF